MNLDQLKAAAISGSAAHEFAKIERERAAWQGARIAGMSSAQLLKTLDYVGSLSPQRIQELTNIGSSISTIGEHYKAAVSGFSSTLHAINAWQAVQNDQQERMRKLLEPLAGLRSYFNGSEALRNSFKAIGVGYSALNDELKRSMVGLYGAGAAKNLWAQQMQGTRTRNALDALTFGGGIGQQLQDMLLATRQFGASPQLVGIGDSLKVLQSHIGEVALPTIDWGSAAALAKVLGHKGLEEQLSCLGIQPDGTLQELADKPEKGLLSRKQSDAIALVGLLLSVLGIWMAIQMFYFQEHEGSIQQAKNDDQAAKQMRQLESLTRLVEKAWKRVDNAEEERFYVRARPATVRASPDHGSTVEGRLMPNEVVRVIDKDRKWVEIEYYHWLHEEYRTGWVLKKYLERVPASYIKKPSSMGT